MVRTLLIRGMLVGLLAGVLALIFAEIFGEPQVNRAIAVEDAIAQAAGEAPEPELISREVQSTVGLATAMLVYSAAFGGLFALAFAYANGRVGSLSPRAVAALVAGAIFVVVFLVPALKYPPNPPSVGNPDTITYRTELFFFMILVSLAALALAVSIARPLIARFGTWNGVLVAAAVFILVIIAAQILLPTIDEVPSAFPASSLWRFRIASLGIQVVIWATIGLVFGALTERSLAPRRVGRLTAS